MEKYKILSRRKRNLKRIREHIMIAEKVLGKPLPKGAIVHHVDENGLNNKNDNLVICQDNSYHKLIHERMKAFAACGDPNARRCRYCKQYDSLDKLVLRPNGGTNRYPRVIYNHKDTACWNMQPGRRKMYLYE